MFRFTIGDVLWLTTLIAVVMTWWLDRSRLVDRCSDAEREVQMAQQTIDELIRAGFHPAYARLSQPSTPSKENSP